MNAPSKPLWQTLLPGATPWLAVSVVAIVADLWTKSWASNALVYGRPRVITPYLDFTLLHNKGAAFSLLAQAGGWQKTFFVVLGSVVSAMLVIWLLRLPRRGRGILALSLALIVGGAVGNLYDRVTLGYVVDFLHFHYGEHYWPAFNIADTAICIGVGLMLLDSFITKEEPTAAAESATVSSGEDESASLESGSDAASPTKGDADG